MESKGNKMATLSINDVKYREDLYPRVQDGDDLLLVTLRFLDQLKLDARIINELFPFHPSLKQSKYRKDVLQFFGRSCFICKYSFFVDVHHVQHQAKGGSDRIDNLVTLCPNHHKEWHYLENTFFNVTIKDAYNYNRPGYTLNMDWQIPDFVMRNKIPPFFIRLLQIAMEN